MNVGNVNGLLFVILASCMGTFAIFYPQMLCKKILESSRSNSIYGFIGNYYSKNGIFKIRAVGLVMYALAGLLFCWMYIR